MRDSLSVEQLVGIPPLIFGSIQWKSSVGAPEGDLCSGFNILVEEHTATQFRDAGGGNIEPIPGTGIWKVVSSDFLSCHAMPNSGNSRAVNFHVTGLHLNAFPDGLYRITPTLRGKWRPPNFMASLGYRTVEPISISVALKESAHIQRVEFEVVRRSFFSGRRLGT